MYKIWKKEFFELSFIVQNIGKKIEKRSYSKKDSKAIYISVINGERAKV